MVFGRWTLGSGTAVNHHYTLSAGCHGFRCDLACKPDVNLQNEHEIHLCKWFGSRFAASVYQPYWKPHVQVCASFGQLTLFPLVMANCRFLHTRQKIIRSLTSNHTLWVGAAEVHGGLANRRSFFCFLLELWDCRWHVHRHPWDCVEAQFWYVWNIYNCHNYGKWVLYAICWSAIERRWVF